MSAFFLCNYNSFAAVTEVEELAFGTLAILKNNVASQITINTNNQINFTNHIRVLVPGHRGEYLLSAYAPFTELFTSANILLTETSSSAPPSEQFTLTSLDTAPSVTTDANGTATVYIGGTIQTSGNASGTYYDTPYFVTFELAINF